MSFRTQSLTGRRIRRFLHSPILKLLLAILFVSDTIRTIHILSSQTAATLQSDPPPKNTKRIYIASQHWNNERVLRDRWNAALVGVIEELGSENVYVSIYESGSWDNTKGALTELDETLAGLDVARKIVLSDVSHKDELMKQPAKDGWIQIPDGTQMPRRIPFLADLRNEVLKPLQSLAEQGQHFDTVLFLNDVVFSTLDVLKLLNTNDGDYAAACSLDFSKPPYYYDTFALRDSNGQETVMNTWPYFRSSASRNAVERFQPVPVTSCWNGMVAMPADPFLAEKPLRFRGISDTLAPLHLEGSECCLIHADNPLSLTKGVFLNPNVRVGYSAAAYEKVRADHPTLSSWAIYKGLWTNRVLRWVTTPMFKEWVVEKRVRDWEKDTKEKEPGEFCLINEMQVLIERGWRHV